MFVYYIILYTCITLHYNTNSDVNKPKRIQFTCDNSGTSPDLQLIGADCEYHHEDGDVIIVHNHVHMMSQKQHI